MPPPIGYGVATLHWAQAGGPTDVTVTMGFDASTVDIADDIAEAIESYLISGVGPCAPNLMTVGWTFVGVSILANPSGLLIAGVSYNNTVGTRVDTGSAVPAYTPYVVTKRTGYVGVQYRGRMYPPLTVCDAENVSGAGQIESFNLEVLQTAWDDAFTLWNGGTWKPYLLHGVAEGMVSPPDPTLVTSLQVQPVVAIQRRRKLRA